MVTEKEIAKNRAQVQKIVNRGVQEPLDRSVFKKTEEEKYKLKNLKKDWQKAQKIKGY